MKKAIYFTLISLFALTWQGVFAQCTGIESALDGWQGPVAPTSCPSMAFLPEGTKYHQIGGTEYVKTATTWIVIPVETDPTFTGYLSSNPNIDTDGTNDWIFSGCASSGNAIGSTDTNLPIMAAGAIVADIGGSEANVKISRAIPSVDVSTAHDCLFIGDGGNIGESTNQIVNGGGIMDIRDNNENCVWVGRDIDHIATNTDGIGVMTSTSGMDANHRFLVVGNKNDDNNGNTDFFLFGEGNKNIDNNAGLHIWGSANTDIQGCSNLDIFGNGNTSLYTGVNDRLVIGNIDTRWFEFDKANGALMLSGSEGISGQVPVSNGPGSAVTWGSPASSGTPLSSITAATATNNIANGNFGQVWNWTNTTQTPLNLASSTATTGGVLQVSSTSTANTGTQGLLNVSNNTATTTGAVARFQSSTVNAQNGLTILANGNNGFGTTDPAAMVDVREAVIMRPITISSVPSSGPIGTAATTVDIASTIYIPQAATGVIATIPAPTNAQSGRLLWLENTGAATIQIGTKGPFLYPPGSLGFPSSAWFEWNGTTWTALYSRTPAQQLTMTTTATVVPVGGANIVVTPASAIVVTIDPSRLNAGEYVTVKDATGAVNGANNVQLAFTSGAPDWMGGIAMNTPYDAVKLLWNGSKFQLMGQLAKMYARNTTGSGIVVTNTQLTTGNLFDIDAQPANLVGSTANALRVSMSGANTNSTVTATTARFNATKTGTASTNVAISANASGGTNNYALVTVAGLAGFNTTAPTSTVHVNGSFATSVTTVSATDTIANNVSTVLLANGATNITVTIPSAVLFPGQQITFTRNELSTGTVTITPAAGQIQALIGTLGATTSISDHSAAGAGVGITFFSNGTNWYRG